ncbi:CGNR zinc finger domain-containing protein [Rhizobium sp. ARZ01]|uniref:CGNR zinc finger domain-containing protein n=1 Tax=Rhizobium sp. ARZ01 TaxID=2769313 RepID=UPI001783EDD2|nr:CGNR zinc finger domain-containing protein [Rhizobium sp. ARZ01]MBD9371723.1 CGNR zinc finger domain-containing protein [Rhizobium sp. ARZ01]
MTFSWTPHRFSGGALALDVANSVVLRFDPMQRIDRYADAKTMDSFAEAANVHCAERDRTGRLAPVAAARRRAFIDLREAIDGHFRAEASREGTPELLAALLEAIADTLRHSGASSGALDAATAHSALRLAVNAEPDRLKICPNCGWLFLDKSRNRSRTWCDMAICGNRAKASRHYYRHREETGP